MYISSGKHKGRIIWMPKGIRPTQNKIRQALFDILRAKMPECSFLDLYAGSGAIGIEAFSNGAAHVTCVDSSRYCASILRKNIGQFNDEKTMRIIVADALKTIVSLSKTQVTFDIVFADPPYHRDLAKKTLQRLYEYDIVAPYGFIVIEHHKGDDMPDQLGNLSLYKQKRYGDTLLSFYRASEDSNQ